MTQIITPTAILAALQKQVSDDRAQQILEAAANDKKLAETASAYGRILKAAAGIAHESPPAKTAPAVAVIMEKIDSLNGSPWVLFRRWFGQLFDCGPQPLLALTGRSHSMRRFLKFIALPFGGASLLATGILTLIHIYLPPEFQICTSEGGLTGLLHLSGASSFAGRQLLEGMRGALGVTITLGATVCGRYCFGHGRTASIISFLTLAALSVIVAILI